MQHDCASPEPSACHWTHLTPSLFPRGERCKHSQSTCTAQSGDAIRLCQGTAGLISTLGLWYCKSSQRCTSQKKASGLPLRQTGFLLSCQFCFSTGACLTCLASTARVALRRCLHRAMTPEGLDGLCYRGCRVLPSWGLSRWSQLELLLAAPSGPWCTQRML